MPAALRTPVGAESARNARGRVMIRVRCAILVACVALSATSVMAETASAPLVSSVPNSAAAPQPPSNHHQQRAVSQRDFAKQLGSQPGAPIGRASASDARAQCPESGPSSGTDEASLKRARGVLESNGFNVDKEYRVTRLVPYASGAGMIWVQRLYRGLPVFRDALAFHFDSQGTLKRDKAGELVLRGEGEDLSRLDVDPKPRIDGEAAKRSFADRATVIDLVDPAGRPAGTAPGPDYRQRLHELDAKLGVFQGALAWRICPRDNSYPYAYVSATTSAVLFFDSGIRT